MKLILFYLFNFFSVLYVVKSLLNIALSAIIRLIFPGTSIVACEVNACNCIRYN